MKLNPVIIVPRLHRTPLAAIIVKDSRVIVEVDDEAEKRIKLIFHPYQAIRMTTADCYIVPDSVGIISQSVVEVVDSLWIGELRGNLKQIDETAKFMDKARHFIVPLQDDFLEVVAWDVFVDDSSAALVVD